MTEETRKLEKEIEKKIGSVEVVSSLKQEKKSFSRSRFERLAREAGKVFEKERKYGTESTS